MQEHKFGMDCCGLSSSGEGINCSRQMGFLRFGALLTLKNIVGNLEVHSSGEKEAAITSQLPFIQRNSSLVIWPDLPKQRWPWLALEPDPQAGIRRWFLPPARNSTSRDAHRSLSWYTDFRRQCPPLPALPVEKPKRKQPIASRPRIL